MADAQRILIIDGDDDLVDALDPVEDLKSQFAAIQEREKAERARADAAERRAAEAERDAIRLAAEASGNDVEGARHRFQQAVDAGDYDAAAQSQAEIARASVRAGRIQQAEPPEDPVEKFASTLSPRAGAWVREHRDIVAKPAGWHSMMAAHHSAVDAGHEPDGDAYYAHVEGRLGLRKPAAEPTEPTEAPQDTPARQSGPQLHRRRRSTGGRTLRRGRAGVGPLWISRLAKSTRLQTTSAGRRVRPTPRPASRSSPTIPGLESRSARQFTPGARLG